MRVADAIAEILTREGISIANCYPTTPLIDAIAGAGIRPILCRQERAGVHTADGYTRLTNGSPVGVFVMQSGPGAENAFPGIATAYSDSAPVLLLPLGHSRASSQVYPLFKSTRTYANVTKQAEELSLPDQVVPVMRRAFAALKNGRRGPVLVEIPADVMDAEIDGPLNYRPVPRSRSAADPSDIDEAARILLEATRPIVHAGAGVLYAEATDVLVELAELVEAPVMTTIDGKSAFPEDHPLALGSGGPSMTGPVYHFLRSADVVLGIGCGFTRYGMYPTIPPDKTIIHATNDARDLSKDYDIELGLLGDAELVLRQLVEAVRDRLKGRDRGERGHVANEIAEVREAWLAEWLAPKLLSDEVPINPYRVIHEFMRLVDPADAIVTHDSGSPRDQLAPFYRATRPRSYLGWGKSHQLGTGLGLTIGAKLAAPDKLCVNFMGDAAFGMTGLEFETAVRVDAPIMTIVLNNSSMACETAVLELSHRLYRTRDIGGSYAAVGRDLGGYGERIEDPADIAGAITRARQQTDEGTPALLEFVTSEETKFSHRMAFQETPVARVLAEASVSSA